MTNADVIRAMSDDELDDFLASFELDDIHYEITFCDWCMKDKKVGGQGNVLGLDCDGCRKHWLQSDATDINGLKYWENRRAEQ